MDECKDLFALKRASFSCFFEDVELKHIFDTGKKIPLKKGHVLFSEGSNEKTMYIILSGELEVYKKHKQIAVRGIGDFVGEMALVESKPRSASVRAISDASLLEIDKTTFFEHFVSNPKVVWEILKVISARNRDDLDAIDLGYQEIRNSREKYRKVVDSVSDLIIQTAPDGKISFANKAVSYIGYDVFDLIGKDFKEFLVGQVSSTSLAHILTRRVGARTTLSHEISLKVNELSTLYDACNSMTFMMTSTGVWNVPQEEVLIKGAQKEFLGSLIVFKIEKNGGYRMV